MLWIDFESRSRCDLTVYGVYNYAQDPSTEVLCMSYAFDDEEVRTWTPDQPFPATVEFYKGQIRAHNAAFERLILWYVCGTAHKLEQFYCTAAQARANCLPGALEDVGRAVSSQMKKDHRGSQLIRQLSMPRADGSFNEDPKLMREMVDYCEQDVRTMRAVSKAMRDLSILELADYHANERINDRGVLIDRELVRAARRFANVEMNEIQDTVREVTNGELVSVRSPKMRQWVYDRVGPRARQLMQKDGKTSIDKSVRAGLLALDDPEEIPPDVMDVIQCADDIWASSVAKYQRLDNLADVEDNRVRGAFVFNGGSATGRACVAADTLVETAFGLRPISALFIGEKVLTHTGRFCKVTRVVYKGRQTMYRVLTNTNAWVDCTAEHRLLTNKGWKNVEELIRDTGPESARGGDAGVYVAAVPYNGRNWADDKPDPCNSFCNRAGDCTAGTATYPESGELLQIEDGRKEPYVWSAETSRSDIETWVSLFMAGRGRVCAGASFSVDDGVGAEDVAGGLGGAPHRQQQGEQQFGQLSDSHESWPRIATQAKITEIVCLGEKGVWDITVEGDASYCAQGLIHHNSSYGAQVHNFTRKCAKEPEAVRQAMVRGHEIVPKYGKRVTDVLKGMLRPSLIPEKGKVFVVADWSAIEARCNPWLANDPLAQGLLDVFANGGDVYVREAAGIFRKEESEVTPDERQIGKVAILSLGYGGSVGAFNNMARAYGITLGERQVRGIVDAWRRSNIWAVNYWGALESAYMRAIRNPKREFSAGRATYMHDGTHLWYALPSKRILCYPFAKIEDDEVTYVKASWKPAADAKEWPRARLWRGLCSENLSQSTANDLLRHALRQLDDVVLHVHDEIVAEVNEADAEAYAQKLKEVMCTPPDWAAGLPLNADVKIMSRYGK